ncbi:hypothetical protein N499_1002B, partial [Wolbachia pipientis wVitA]|jgi:hypothetical protein
LYV